MNERINEENHNTRSFLGYRKESIEIRALF